MTATLTREHVSIISSYLNNSESDWFAMFLNDFLNKEDQGEYTQQCDIFDRTFNRLDVNPLDNDLYLITLKDDASKSGVLKSQFNIIDVREGYGYHIARFQINIDPESQRIQTKDECRTPSDYDFGKVIVRLFVESNTIPYCREKILKEAHEFSRVESEFWKAVASTEQTSAVKAKLLIRH